MYYSVYYDSIDSFFFLFLYLSQLSSGLHKMKEEIHRLWSHSEARKTSETGSAIWIFQRSASEWIHSSIFCFLFPSHFSFSYVCDLFRCVVVLKYNALRMGCVGPPPSIFAILPASPLSLFSFSLIPNCRTRHPPDKLTCIPGLEGTLNAMGAVCMKASTTLGEPCRRRYWIV